MNGSMSTDQSSKGIRDLIARPAVRIGIAATTLLAIHLALLSGQVTIAVSIILAGCVIGWATSILRGFPWISTVFLTMSVLLFAAALIFLASGYKSAALLLLAPPFLTFLGLATLFGRTLFPGREPLINRFIRLELGEVPRRVADHGRRLTLVWTIMFVAMAIETVVVMFTTDLATWTWLINIVNPAIIVLFFVGQHIHAMTYRPDGRPAPARTTIKVMFTPDFWSEERLDPVDGRG